MAIKPRLTEVSRRILTAVSIAVLCGLIGGCYTGTFMYMDVLSYRDPGRHFDSMRKFAVVYGSNQEPLLEKEIMHLVKQELTGEGYIYDELEPDFLVLANWYVGSYEYYEPPKKLRLPYYVKGEKRTTSGWVGGDYVSLTEQSESLEHMELELSPGGIKTEFYRLIRLDFVDGTSLAEDSMLSVIWTGIVDSYGKARDILIVAPVMLDELLEEFPYRTERFSIRRRYDVYQYEPPEFPDSLIKDVRDK